MTEAKNIHEAMLRVYNAIGYVQKTGKVEFGKTKYSYVGVDAMIEALRPHFLDAGLYAYTVSAKVATHTANHLLAEYTFRIVHAASGESIEVQAIGEGMDSGDKGAYKCATGAFKYFLRQAFMLSTGDDDPDKEASDEVVQKIDHKAATQNYKLIMQKLEEAGDVDELTMAWNSIKSLLPQINAWNPDKFEGLRMYCKQRGEELKREAEFTPPPIPKEPMPAPVKNFTGDPETPDHFGDQIPF